MNLSENLIKTVDGLSSLPKLNTVQLAQNNIQDYDDLVELKKCRAISSLELNKNKIDYPRVIDIFAQLPMLKVLKLDGNPVTRKIPHYRKALICRLKNLTYLDDRPVFPDERLMAEAWGRGGVEAEKVERTRQRKWREETERNRHKEFFKYIDRARKERLAKEKDGKQSDKGWKPVNASDADDDDGKSTGKEREAHVRYDVHENNDECAAAPATQSWALPRRARKECVIQEVNRNGESLADAPAVQCGRSSKQSKRASRQTRLKKAMALVQEIETADEPPARGTVEETSTEDDSKPAVETKSVSSELEVLKVEALSSQSGGFDDDAEPDDQDSGEQELNDEPAASIDTSAVKAPVFSKDTLTAASKTHCSGNDSSPILAGKEAKAQYSY